MNLPPSVLLSDINRFLDWRLRVAEIPDYPNALNGLQLDNSGLITRVVAAVDARLATVRNAAARGPRTLLLVHHGMFWGGTQRLVGNTHKLWKAAIEGDLAIYSSHLPLDVHPELGNNAGLLSAIGIDPALARPFFDYKNTPIGLRGHLSPPLRRGELIARLEKAIAATSGNGGNGCNGVRLCLGGPERVEHLGVITGGAGNELRAVAAAGIDTFITGEGAHWTHALAEELGVNVLYGGHYATETFGVKALAAHVAEKFGLPWEFIDYPTGL
ncbi:MAG: Nif3-like dinuclear metal center hexameric protein [Verrucomicrobia bacterium]|nr:Nif3-like dinuclear metal center hexameric protein [Verrucomicrobiota bacterium]